ncbi:hypothetical protein [Wolbachia endosymbiont (group A) of Agelastica alni]|uniref:hypothetical protein n=1 Tax=unclassified Wolbachia TaxID=2640676 RepID=UPI002230A364|nr:hypothetical protein [Wolbachia endosymbiont (group A) of Apoderus coryli]
MTIVRLAVIPVWNPGKRMVSSQCPDTGIQESLLVYKQTSIESGYNVFDEIIWKTGSQCQALG